MNNAKKLFFILIFSLLFFVPSFSQAATGKCISQKDAAYCATFKTEIACNTSMAWCKWYVQVPLKDGSCVVDTKCNGLSYAKCISSALTQSCQWSGTIPEVAASQEAASLPIVVPKIDNPTGVLYVRSFIGNIINAVFGLVGTIALLMFIYGGVAWMTAGGNSEKVKKSRDTLVWAALGLTFIFLSYAIASVVIKALS